MADSSASSASRVRSSHTHPDFWDELGLCPTEEVHEVEEETHSSLLGPDGKHIPYQSKKLGHIGFIKLKERQ